MPVKKNTSLGYLAVFMIGAAVASGLAVLVSPDCKNPRPAATAVAPLGTPVFTDAVKAKFAKMAGPPAHELWSDLIQPQVDDSINATGSPGVYGDMGLGALIKFQIDPVANQIYAQHAANILTASMHDGLADRNWIRGYFGQAVITTYLVKDAIDPALLATMKGQLQTICNTCLGINTPDYAGGFRITDTDQTIGQFFGLMACQQCFPDIVVGTVSGGGGNETHVLGGLDSTAADDTTVRNAIRRLVELAKGGEWLVSSGYNFSDDTYLLQFMWLSLKQITGQDHFPEILAWMKQWAWVLITDVTPDLANRFHWGDDQSTDVGWWDYATALNICARCLEEAGEKTLASYVQFRFNECFAKFGVAYPNRVGPQTVLWLDPYAPAADYHAAMPRTVDCSQGVGQVIRRDDKLAAFAFSPNDTGVDHQTAFVGTLQIYDDGRPVLWNPIGYGSVDDARPLNCPLYGGYSTFNIFGSIAPVDGDNYLLTGGRTSGFPGWTGQYDPPPSFAPTEQTRLHFWLPQKKTVVVLDRFNLDDPRLWSDKNKTDYPAVQKAISGFALKQVMWHVPTPAPTTSPTGASWALADNSPVRLDCISSAGALTVAVDDESPDAKGETIFGGANVWNPVNGKCSRIRFMSDRAGPECVLSVFQWGITQVVPDLNVGANTIVCGLGADTEVAFALDGTMPVRTTVAGVTDYLVGTDSTGKWNVAVQTATPDPNVTPATIQLPPQVITIGGSKYSISTTITPAP